MLLRSTASPDAPALLLLSRLLLDLRSAEETLPKTFSLLETRPPLKATTTCAAKGAAGVAFPKQGGFRLKKAKALRRKALGRRLCSRPCDAGLRQQQLLETPRKTLLPFPFHSAAS